MENVTSQESLSIYYDRQKVLVEGCSSVTLMFKIRQRVKCDCDVFRCCTVVLPRLVTGKIESVRCCRQRSVTTPTVYTPVSLYML